MKIRMKRLRTGSRRRIMFEVPEQADAYLESLFIKARQCSQDFLDVSISLPGKSRSTGKYSQNHHVNGHCMQIAAETGNSFEAVKMEAKKIAAEQGRWKWQTLPSGSVYPGSESEATVEEAAGLIEVLHQLAAEYDIRLIEA